MSGRILHACEAQLQSSLGRAAASPYLAHHELAEAESLQELIREHVDGDRSVLGCFFKDFPHLAIWSVARALADSWGKNGNHECYPPIGAAFGFTGDLSQDLHNWLLHRFRRAASRLGLTLPIAGEVFDFERVQWRVQQADCFFTQAGVALMQASHLADIFWRGRSALGDPSSDHSTNTLVEWEREAIKLFCPGNLGRIPKLILAGANGYHAHAFARLLEKGNPGNRFEVALKEAMDEKVPARTDLNVRLLCVDASLVVQNFHGNASFKVRGHLPQGLETLVLGSRLTLPTPWPAWVECQSGLDENAPWLRLDLFGEQTRALIFSGQTGRLQARVSQTSKVLHLGLGEIIVFAAEPFRINSIAGLDGGRKAFLWYHDLTGSTILAMDGLEVELVPRPQPTLRLVHGGNLGHFGTSPFLASISVVTVENPGVASGEGLTEFEVNISHPAMETVALPCEADAATGVISLDLKEVLPTTGAFGLMSLELRPRGSNRVLQRETVWYWPGLAFLDTGDGRFHGISIPPNWEHEQSQHIDLDEGGLRLEDPAHHPYLEAKLVFRGDGHADEKPLAEFSFPPPGLSLAKDSENGPRPLRWGERTALAAGDGTTITIRTHDPRVRLEINGILETNSFDRSCIRRLASEVLAAHGRSEIRAEFPDRRGQLETLLRIDSIEMVRKFWPVDEDGMVILTLDMGRSPQALRVRGEGLLGGQVYEWLEGNDLKVEREQGGGMKCTFSWEPMTGPDIYLCALQADFGDGWWRTLTNAKQECLDWAVNPTRTPTAEMLGDANLPDLFLKLTQAVNRRAPAKCQDSITSHVLNLWRAVGLQIRNAEGGQGVLLEGARIPWADETAWVPVYHPIELAPELFEAPLGCFKGRASNEASPGFEHIDWLGRMTEAESTQDALAMAGVIPHFGVAYRNGFQVDRGIETVLRNFEYSRYASALDAVPEEDQQSFWTPRQFRLSIAHHSWCCERFADRLSRLAARPAHVHKLKYVVLDAEVAARNLNLHQELHPELPASLRVKFSGDAGIVFQHGPGLLSLWARCSRTGRTRELLMTLLGKEYDPGRRDHRHELERTGQVIRLAPELFGFYLLLWELAAKGAC